MQQKRSWFSELNTGPKILLVLFALGVVIATVYLIQKANDVHQKIIQLNFIALLLGLIFEYKRIATKWSTVGLTALVAYLLSFLAFARGKHSEGYDLSERIVLWPYCFLGIFILSATIVYYSSVTKKITEGVTLLLTIAINYWILANNYWNTDQLYIKCLILLNIFLSLFAIYNALTYQSLSKGSRLALSIWSSLITLLLATDNFLKLYEYRNIEALPFSEATLIFIQFFLLGISSIYIAQNLTMILAYLPGKGFMQSVRDMNDIHLKRYSGEQVTIANSIIVIAIAVIGFTLNHFLFLLPANLVIWAMVVLTPLLLYVIRKVLG